MPDKSVILPTYHRFLPLDDEDMFYIPWGGNDAELNRLYSLVDEYRTEIASEKMPVYVDSYSASMRLAERNQELAFTRANRVKSELITHKGLVEENSVTKKHTTAYEGNKDMVVMTLRIPAQATEPVVETKPEPVKEEPPVAEQKPEPVVEKQPEPEIIPEPAPVYSRWSVGANVGMPFFWSDMTSNLMYKPK